MIRVILLGGGNVAYHLACEFLQNPGFELVQLYNRTLDAIEVFKGKTKLTDTIADLQKADLYVLAVSDKAISGLSSKLCVPDKLVVHTSGAMPLETLESVSRKGVLYPLQTFSKNRKVSLSEVPFCIETEHPQDRVLLEKTARTLSKHCHYIDSSQRKTLHVSAVFVNNYVNHLYHLAHSLCETQDIPVDLLQPLIEETAQKIRTMKPLEAQTGPARRGDHNSLEEHQKILTEKYRELYTLLAKSIADTYG
ncbi:MAG: DUF2520 domain-containing protein [Lutibacter sp.]|nr:DUF2520 domain-containing protein [Lutibacter sp.]